MSKESLSRRGLLRGSLLAGGMTAVSALHRVQEAAAEASAPAGAYAQPTRRYGPMPEGKVVLQTEDVVVDRRGFIYISDKDKNQGVWILRYTGPKLGSSLK